jgi:hypothetical protein
MTPSSQIHTANVRADSNGICRAECEDDRSPSTAYWMNLSIHFHSSGIGYDLGLHHNSTSKVRVHDRVSSLDLSSGKILYVLGVA